MLKSLEKTIAKEILIFVYIAKTVLHKYGALLRVMQMINMRDPGLNYFRASYCIHLDPGFSRNLARKSYLSALKFSQA